MEVGPENLEILIDPRRFRLKLGGTEQHETAAQPGRTHHKAQMNHAAQARGRERAKECGAPPGDGSISVGSGAASGGSRLSGGSSGDGGIRLSSGRLRAGSRAP